MKKLQTVLIALVALLGLAGMAEASADLWTPPLIDFAGQAADCRISNVTALTRTVQVRIYDQSGTVRADSGTFSLTPFAQAIVGASGPIQFVCRFTAPSKSTVRGAAVVRGGSSDVIAVPAQ